MPKQIFVSPNNDKWKIKVVDNQKASAICDTKTEAVKKAIEIAKNQHLELIIQKKNGIIDWKNSYGNDPKKSRG